MVIGHVLVYDGPDEVICQAFGNRSTAVMVSNNKGLSFLANYWLEMIRQDCGLFRRSKVRIVWYPRKYHLTLLPQSILSLLWVVGNTLVGDWR